ncbi:MAG: hypothetical protein HYY40_11785, partial [Bacteroidetes bacterium]|nr:hypothetical protein [Bacteroidota bacterium]
MSSRTLFHVGLLLSGGLLLSPVTAFPKNQTYSQYLSGTSICTNCTLTTKDLLFPDPYTTSAWYDDIPCQQVNNYIVLRFDPASDLYFSTPFTIAVTCTISAYDKDNNLLSLPDNPVTLTVEYDNTDGATPDDKAIYKFTAAHKVTLEITGISGTVTGNLILENIIEVERYDAFNPSATTPPCTTYTLLNSQVTAGWAAVPGAEEYDLEWAHVNDYFDGVTNVPPADIDYSFRNNSTRIQIKNTAYSFPAVFEGGWVLLRYRPIGRGGTDCKNIVAGIWSEQESGKVTACTSRVQVSGATNIHEGDNLNWQYTANYAEEGKNKVAVSYFDGSLRNRQTVSKINTANIAIVGETVYDHQGRGAIQVLPVPVCTTGTPAYADKIEYYENFNRNSDGAPFNRTDFDLDIPFNPCTVAVETLSITSGASQYYSTANTDITGHNGYIPSADGYPFTQIEYTPDNTGRIRRQSGVGKNHILGSDHETKYFYGKPGQEHLDRLFGSEAGYFSHYKKNLVVDANGQVSISYLDQQGRVIATSLAGDNPTTLDALPSKSVSEVTMTINILDNKPFLSENPALVSTHVFLASSAGDYTFDFSVSATDFDPECTPSACYDCVYDLTISVRDECEVELEKTPYSCSPTCDPIRKTVGRVLLTGNLDLDNSCDDPTFSLNENFTVNFPKVGNYTITKTLTVNEEALLFYLNDYLNDENCVTPHSTFIATSLANTDFTGCIPADNCETVCEREHQGGTPTEIAACIQQCETIDKCSIGYQAMLADFYPGGQYAKFVNISTSTITDFSASGIPWSILNTDKIEDTGDGILDCSDDHINSLGIDYTCISWSDEDMVSLPDGSLKFPGELTLEEFIIFFKPSWAEKMVLFHPEYCYYQWCLTENNESDDYDELMRNTKTYDEAFALGLFNPLGLTEPSPDPPYDVFPFRVCSPPPGSYPDPFFETGDGKFFPVKSYIETFMTEYEVTAQINCTPGPCVTISDEFTLWQLAAASVECQGLTDLAKRSCADNIRAGDFDFCDPGCNADRIWEIFRALYLAEKDRLVEIARNCYVEGQPSTPPYYPSICISLKSCPGPNPCCNGAPGNFSYDDGTGTGNLITVETQVRFPDIASLVQPGVNIYGDPDDMVNALQTESSTALENNCTDHCEGYAATWLEKLAGCNPSATPWDETNPVYLDMKTKLIELCIAGCDQENPLGSSSLPDGHTGIAPLVSGDPNYFNFNDVVEGVMKFHGVTALSLDCNGDLINFPYNYGHGNRSITVGGNMDNCACDKILQIQKYYDNYPVLPRPQWASTPEKLFQQAYGLEVENFQGKVCLCNDAFVDGTGVQWSPGAEWPATSIGTLQSSGEFIQSQLVCPGTCPSCDDIQNEINDYTSDVVNNLSVAGVNSDLVPVLTNSMLATHLNNVFDLDLTYQQYADFLEKCNEVTAGQYSCGDITIEAWDLMRTLNLLADMQTAYYYNAGESELLTEACLCIPPYGNPPTDPDFPFDPDVNTPIFPAPMPYTNSLVPNTDPSYTYSNATDVCDHYYQFSDINGETLTGHIITAETEAQLCTLHLTFIQNGFEFKNIIRFMNIRPDPDHINSTDLVSGTTSYYFLIDAEVSQAPNHPLTVITTLAGHTTCFPIVECTNDISDLTLCNPQELITPEERCTTELVNTAIFNATQLYEDYLEQVKQEFRNAYIAKCLEAAETFTMEYDDNEYHYTLYYYDQAGNLVRTVPPEGVELLDISDPVLKSHIASDRLNHTRHCFTNHGLPTTYRYNSLNQLTTQSVPDYDDFDDWKNNNPAITGLADVQDIDMTGQSGTGYMIDYDPADGLSDIFKTDDGGATWSQVNSLIAGALNEVDYINANNAWAVGNNGMLLKTTNGGTSWQLVQTAVAGNLAAVDFINSTDGFIFTANGAMYKTTDGGLTWPAGPYLTGLTQLNDAVMDGSGNGYAAGINSSGRGAIAATSDFGVNWSLQNNIGANNLNDVNFFNNNYGVAAGQDGTLLYTIDGGDNWAQIAAASVENIKEAHMVEYNKVLLLTNAGVLIPGTITAFSFTSATPLNIPAPPVTDIYFAEPAVGYALQPQSPTSFAVFKIYYTAGTWNFLQWGGGTGPANSISVSLNQSTNFYEGYIAGNGFVWVNSNITNSSAWSPLVSIPGINIRQLHIYHFSAVWNGAAILNNNDLIAIQNVFIPSFWTAPAQQSTGPYSEMHFYSASGGYALKEDGSFASINLSTPLIDAALTCDAPVASPSVITSLFFTTATNGWAVGTEGNIFKYQSPCTGTSWLDKRYNLSPLPLNGIAYLNAAKAVAVGDDGTAFFTANSGTSWQMANTGTSENINSVNFYDASSGFMAGAGGTLFKSTNSGQAWSDASSTSGITTGIQDIAYTPSDIGFAVAFGNQASKQDAVGGSSWTALTLPPASRNLNGISAGTNNDAVTVGNNASLISILKTSDAGLTWSEQNTNIKVRLKSLMVINANEGWAAGDNGILLHLAISGNNASWTLLNTGTTENLTAVWFENGTGLITGENQTLLYTADGGTTWIPGTVTACPGCPDLTGVTYNDIVKEGALWYVVGGNGAILRSDDGAITWSQQPYPSADIPGNVIYDLNAIALNDYAGYIVGSSGIILKSEDCSDPLSMWAPLLADPHDGSPLQDWATFLTGSTKNLTGVEFVDYRTGYVTGADGLLIKTIDGGLDWELRNSSTPNDLNALALSGSENLIF